MSVDFLLVEDQRARRASKGPGPSVSLTRRAGLNRVHAKR